MNNEINCSTRRTAALVRLMGAASLIALSGLAAAPALAQQAQAPADAEAQQVQTPADAEAQASDADLDQEAAKTTPETDPASAAAEQPVAAPDGDVVVTGFRSSLAKALNVKRNEAAATDSILAEDIGKFPDLNLSESIQRIPGVALARDGGEGRQITVRGLGPQFTRVRINGMEALTTAGGSDASGGTNRSRSFDFNIFAADLFNAITVRKSAEATVDEGSLGATVDLRTARPFDYRGFTLSASAQASYNDLFKKATPRGAVMISNTFANDTLGALVSVAYTKRKIKEEGPSTVRWAPGTSFQPGFESVGGVACQVAAPVPAECATVNAAQHPRFPREDQFMSDQERLGVTASLQWRPSNQTLITLDGLYADFSGTREERYLEAPAFSVGGACTAANRPTTCGLPDIDVVDFAIEDGVMHSGTFNDVDLRVENRFDILETKFKQITLDASQELGPVTLNFLAGHSSSKHNNPVQNTLTMDQFNVDNYSYDYGSPDGREPIFDFGTAQLTSPTAWRLSQIRLRAATAKNTYDTAQLAAQWDLDDEFRLDAGVSFKKYKFQTTEFRRQNPAAPSTNQETTIPPAIANTPLAQFTKEVSFAGHTFLIPDYFAGDELFDFGDPTVFGGAFALGPGPSLGNNATIRERNKSAFAQLSFDRDLGGVMLRGNIGLRYVKTEQDSTGFAIVANQLNEITVPNSYDDWLPSTNIVIEPTEELLFRFAAARVMARPNLGNLNPGATINVSGANRGVSGGNPFLEPFRADSYDFAAEWYFQPGALLSVALFYKDVESFIATLQSRGTFDQNPFGMPASLATAACGNLAGCDATTTIWTFSSPANTPGGPVKGFEINYQQPLRFLPGFLGNMGVLLNYTGVKSKIQYLNAAGAVVAETDLTNLSRRSANATLYYEDRTFSARVSGSYRSRYLTQVPASEAGNDVQGTNSTFNVDASVQYTLNDNLKLSLEGVNLTDERQDQFVDSRNMLSVYHHTGREILVGLRYTY